MWQEQRRNVEEERKVQSSTVACSIQVGRTSGRPQAREAEVDPFLPNNNPLLPANYLVIASRTTSSSSSTSTWTSCRARRPGRQGTGSIESLLMGALLARTIMILLASKARFCCSLRLRARSLLLQIVPRRRTSMTRQLAEVNSFSTKFGGQRAAVC